MYACVGEKNRKIIHPVPGWDRDSEEGDVGSFLSIIPRHSEDADTCICIAHTSVDEESNTSHSSASEASSSVHSRLSIGVHFADEIGLPIHSTYHYDHVGDSLPLPEPPKIPKNNPRWEHPSCELNPPEIPKSRKRFSRWDDPSCEPSNRWI